MKEIGDVVEKVIGPNGEGRKATAKRRQNGRNRRN
jgi:hypothetical protein